jgi:prophage regulatory protein
MAIQPVPSKLLRLPAVCERTGLSRTTLYRWVADGRFPHPIKVGPRLIAWPSRTIDQWIVEQELIG